MPKHVTVFGGSTPKPGEPAYEQARRLGSCLAQAGWVVLNGGYIGTMEAVSRGAAEMGGHVIGVTCEEIGTWRPVRSNPWITEEMRLPTLKARLHALIENCDAALALPGGIGTLAEIAIMWNYLQAGVISPCPLILIGPGWRQTFETLLKLHGDYIKPEYRGLLAFTPDVDDAFNQVQRLLGERVP